jgi:hypothetical protein
MPIQIGLMWDDIFTIEAKRIEADTSRGRWTDLGKGPRQGKFPLKS